LEDFKKDVNQVWVNKLSNKNPFKQPWVTGEFK